VERLVRDGASVRALVRYTSHGGHGFLDKVDVREELEIQLGDVRDASSVKAAVDGCDTIFHLAALIGIPYSYESPDSYVRTNIDGTLNILDAARSRDARVVHTSTSEVYGTATTVPMTEAHPLNAQSPYAATKIGADMLALSYARSFGMAVTVMRPFNTYGPRQSARAVIPTIASQLLVGPDVRIGSLAPERDFTFVTDMAAAFAAIAACDEAVGRTVNVGSGTSISIGDLVERIGRVVGRKPHIVVEEKRVRPAASEVDVLRADNSLALQLFGWTPHVTLEDGLGRTVDWIRDHSAAYRVGAYAR
jgi:dTDP-glucose 4,6-dehydratase